MTDDLIDLLIKDDATIIKNTTIGINSIEYLQKGNNIIKLDSEIDTDHLYIYSRNIKLNSDYFNVQLNGYNIDFSVKKLDPDCKLLKLNFHDIISFNNCIMLSLKIDKETAIFIFSLNKTNIKSIN